MAQRTKANLLAATVTPPLCVVADGLTLLPVLLEVLSLEDEDEDVEDDVADEEADDSDEVACSLALLLNVEFFVEFVLDMVMFAMLPITTVEFVPEPVVVELLGVPALPVELLPDVGPEGTTGTLFELDEAVGEGEEAVADVGEEAEAEAEAKAAAALVGQVEQPPNSWSMPE